MWVRSDDTLPGSRKIGVLVRALGWTRRGVSGVDEAMGIVHRLWYAVMQERPSGVLDGWSPEDVAFKLGRAHEDDAAQGRLGLGEAAGGMAVVDALLASGFLDVNEDGTLFLPGWLSRNGHRQRELERKGEAELPIVPRGTTGTRGNPTESHGNPRDSHATGRNVTGEDRSNGAAAPDRSKESGSVRGLVGMIAGARTMRAGNRAPWADAVDAEAKARGIGPGELRVAMQVAAKLARSGITTPAVLAGIAAHYFDNRARVANPFAYYTAGGTAASVLALVLAGRMGMDESEAHKRADELFLRGVRS